MSFAKILFQQLGSFDAPKSQAEDFLDFMKNYQSAREKVIMMRKLEELFTTYPDLENFKLRSFYYHETGQSVAEVEYVTWKGEFKKFPRDYVNEVLSEDMVESLDKVVIEPATIKDIKYLTKEEETAFYSVDHFEKRALDAQLVQPGTKTKTVKI